MTDKKKKPIDEYIENLQGQLTHYANEETKNAILKYKAEGALEILTELKDKE